MNYSSSLRYLYSLQKFGIKLGLRKIRSLLAFIGNPETQFPSIHIAGTNGKGSTAAMIASILQEAGYDVGLYTSPHLIDFTERIRINGISIDKKIVADHTEKLKPKIDELKCTFFEATTAIAFLYYAEKKVDVAVIETGLGGRLDATNVLRPLLSVITSIALEHTEHLGKTLGRIAREKAGILKREVPCLIGELGSSAEHVVRRVARENGAKLISAPAVAECEIGHEGFDGIDMNLKTQKGFYKDLFVSLAGGFQAENARLAVLACELLTGLSRGLPSRHGKFSIRSHHIYAGLRKIQRNTGLRGRLETIRTNPRIMLDVAHNADAVNRLVEALRNLSLRECIIVFGVMKDKNYIEMLTSLREIAAELIVVSPRIERALDSQTLLKIAQGMDVRTFREGSVRNGVARALKRARKSDTILITGSHYVVGEALQALGHGR